MTHPYITAYEELNSQTKVAKRFGVSRSVVRRIVDPEAHEKAKQVRNVHEKKLRADKQEWTKENRQRIHDYFAVLIARENG